MQSVEKIDFFDSAHVTGGLLEEFRPFPKLREEHRQLDPSKWPTKTFVATLK